MKKIVSIICVVSLLVFSACTSTPQYPSVITPSEPSYEGNNANSGVLYQITDGGFIISENLKNKYDVYLKKYYKNLGMTKLDTDSGTIKVYYITDEVMNNLLKMHTWEKNAWMVDTPASTSKK